MDSGANPDPLVLDLEPSQAPPPLVQVRQWTRTALVDLGDDHIDAVLLVATELVTNAYEHGSGPSRIRLEHNREPCWVRVEVDDSVEEVPVVGQSSVAEHRGRGMIIVDKLATSWGTRPRPGGKMIWAEIGCGPQTHGIPACPPLVRSRSGNG